MINLLLNILTYQNIDKKFMMYFSKMCYDLYYHLIKVQFKTLPMHEEIKKINCITG